MSETKTFDAAIYGLFGRNGWTGTDDSKITLKQGDLRKLLSLFYKLGADTQRATEPTSIDLMRAFGF